MQLARDGGVSNEAPGSGSSPSSGAMLSAPRRKQEPGLLARPATAEPPVCSREIEIALIARCSMRSRKHYFSGDFQHGAVSHGQKHAAQCKLLVARVPPSASPPLAAERGPAPRPDQA